MYIYFIFYFFLKNNNTSKINEEARLLLLLLIKKDSSIMMNNELICNNYNNILSSENYFSFDKKINIFIFFKEIIKEEIIKRGEFCSELIEEMIFLGEEIKKKKEIMNVKEELINEINDYLRIAKEKGFEGKIWENKNEKVVNYIFCEWKEICKEVLFSFIFFNLFFNLFMIIIFLRIISQLIMKKEKN